MQGTAIFKIKFGTLVVQVVPNWWYRNGTGGGPEHDIAFRVVPKWTLDRYRNGSPCGPEIVWYRTRPTPIPRDRSNTVQGYTVRIIRRNLGLMYLQSRRGKN